MKPGQAESSGKNLSQAKSNQTKSKSGESVQVGLSQVKCRSQSGLVNSYSRRSVQSAGFSRSSGRVPFSACLSSTVTSLRSLALDAGGSLTSLRSYRSFEQLLFPTRHSIRHAGLLELVLVWLLDSTVVATDGRPAPL